MPSAVFGEDEAINLLSLDGGGVRGVSSLLIVHEIMMRIKEMHGLDEIPKPCDFFHMIAGTSTGGLIAIMLGRLRMSTTEALQAYDDCAAAIFSGQNRKWSLSHRFRATALEKVVQGIVESRGMGDEMWDPAKPEKGKAIVCVMPSDAIEEPRMVRSFRDPNVEHPWDEGVKIWEAARATTAAPSFFKGQKLGKGPDARTYIDAAIGANNPVEYLLKEAADEFGSGRRLGCVVSIGTGTRSLQLNGLPTLREILAYYGGLFKALKSTATDCEETHRQVQSRLRPFPGSYFRFNVPKAAEEVKLHEYKKMPQLKASTAKYLATEAVSMQIEQVADGLRADAFDHGLTLGHVFTFDKEQVVLSNIRAQSMGTPCPYFTGRTEILKRLDLFFAPRSTPVKPRREFLLFGMGGVGKSEIALKVAQNIESRFKYLFYIDGSTSTTINQSYAYIAKRQGLGDGGIREMKRIAMNWIEDLTEEWLMIFDDCKLDDRRTELPGRGKGNIIYTSRLSSLKEALGGDCVWEVSPLTEAEAIELLLKASGSSNPSLEDQERAQAIVRELGCLPLAIDKAAVSIRDMYRSLGAYLQMLRREKVRLTTDSDPVDESVENMAVTAALELSCNALLGVKRQRGRSGHRAAVVALKILQLLSFYHHRGISVFILERAARQRRDGKGDRIYLISDVDKDLDGLVRTTADGSWDSTNFYVGLRLLWRFSFVSVSLYHMTISMHVLVQQWAQRRIGKAYRRWCLAAKILLNESIIASSKLADRQFARYQRSHLDACLATPSELLDHEPYDARLQLKLGWCYLQGKDFQQAETKLRRALYLHKMLYGNHAWGTIETLLYLAQLYHEEGFLGRSELLYLEIIGRLEERYRNRSDFLEALEHGQTDKTRAGSSEASSQGMSAGSPSSRSQKLSVRLLERVAIPKRLSRRLPEPPSKGKQVAFDNVDSGPDPSISPPSLPEGMSDVLDTLDNINNIIHWTYAEYSYVLRDQGRYANGKRMLLTMVERLEETMDKNHPELLKHQYQARRLTHPGDKAYWEQEIDKAKALSGEAREVFWNHDCIHALILGYANSLAQNKEWADAYYVLLEAEALVLRSYGYSDYRMIEIMRLQVKANIEFGKFDEAARLARECARQAEATYGKAHKETILAKQRLVTAILHQRMDFDDECRANLQDALEGALVVYGSAHSTTKAIRRMLERGREEKDIRRREVDASTSSDANTAVDTDMAATETDSRIEAGPDMETISNRMKETAESLVTRFGPEHPWGKRVKSLVDGGPVKSLEESAERFRGCFGAENRTIKGLEENLRTREANLARLLLSSAFPKTGPLIITPARWEVLKENAEKVIDLLGPGEPLSIGMKALAEGGPAKNADDFLERVREAFGWQRGITQDVEEGIRLRRRTRHPTSAIVNLESVPELGEGAAGNG